MEATFTRQVWLIIIDKLAIGLIVLAAGFLLNRLLERFKSEQALRKDYEALRDQAALKHLQCQIEELYSPLLGLIQHSRFIYQVAKQKLPRFHQDLRGIATNEEAEIWRYFVEGYFLPLNRQMADLIRAKIHLVDSDEIPPSFEQFLVHQIQYDCLHALWKDKGIASDAVAGSKWPADFEKDVRVGLSKLRKEHNEFVRRIKATS
jgi:hypothetical protein